MWSQPRIEPVRRTVSTTVALIVLAGALTAGCSDIYLDRRETVALGADDHIAANTVEQMVDPWPRHVENRNIAFNGERIQAGVERYRRHEVVQPMPLTTNTYTAQHPPPPLSTEHIPNVEPEPMPAAAAPVAGAKQ